MVKKRVGRIPALPPFRVTLTFESRRSAHWHAALGAARARKVDRYVLETDVHFPTGLNLLWDAGRKCVDWVEQFRRGGDPLPGWRTAKAWRRQLKNLQRSTSQIVYRGGPNKEARVKSAMRAYPVVGRALAAKGQASLLELCDQPVAPGPWEALEYVQRMLANGRFKHC